MAIKILSAKEYATKLKCTIHASGRMGFTEATADKLKLSEKSAVKFAVDENESSELYLIKVGEVDEESFKVSKAGGYYSVNAKILFDNLGFDYVNNVISFDMVEVKMEGIEDDIYKLIKREKPRK